MRRLLVCTGVAIASVMAWTPAAESRSLIHDVEKSLHHLRNELCASMPSSKCRAARKAKSKVKKQEVAPAPKPAPESTPEPAPSVTPEVKAAPAKPSTISPISPPAKPVIPVPEPKPAHLKAQPAIPGPPVKPKLLTPVAPPPRPQEKPADLKEQAPPPAAPEPAPVVAPKVPVPPPPPVVAAPAPQPVPADDGCLKAMAATGAVFSPVPPPVASAECVVNNPVRLNSLKTSAGMIKLPDQPIVACHFALTLQGFVADKVQPLAQSEMNSPIASMGTGPGFDCRGRNGDSSSKLSEHARGNAVDIVFFNFVNKSGVLVKDALDSQTKGFAFLRDVRAEACKTFATVLGPGANAAHAEHFHIDLEERKGGYKICE